jgi:hypothetical protein
MGVRVRLAGHALVAELRAVPFGINDQQHQVEGITVERVGHLVHLPGRRGVDEPFLRQGPAARGHRVLAVAAGLLPVRRLGDVVDQGHGTGV